MGLRGMRLILIVITSMMLLLFVVTPFMMREGNVIGLSGTPLIMDFGHIWSDMDPLPMLTYGLGDILCHQQSDRSLILNGSQMAVCIRDFFIMAGFLSGSIYFLLTKCDVRLGPLSLFIIVSTLLLLADHSLQSVFSANVPSTRAITGFLFGTSVSGMIEYQFAKYETPSDRSV